MNEFTSLNVLITGAGSGIGLTTARKLKELGAHVLALDIHRGELDADIYWSQCDIGDSASVQQACEEINGDISHIDIIINNAGIGAVGTVLDASDDEWARVFNINVTGIARIVKAFYPLLVKSENPSIVNTCSIAAEVGLPKRAIYSASKGAVSSLTLAMAADFIGDGVRVNCVNPGTADTPWIARLLAGSNDKAGDRAALEARQPLGRLVSAEEVAQAIIYLASPLQKSTTGTILHVDGGLTGLRLPK